MQLVDVPPAACPEAVVDLAVARPHDVEEERRAAVVQVRPRVPDVVQHRRHVLAEHAAARRDRRASRRRRDGERVGAVEEIRGADVVPEERVVAVGAGGLARDELLTRALGTLVGEELSVDRPAAVVALRAAGQRVVEQIPATRGGLGGGVRIRHELGE